MKIEMKKRVSSMVKPAEKTRRRSIPCTLADELFPFPRYNSVVIIYKAAKTKDHTAAQLRESLSKTLVHFYVVAGRYTLGSDARSAMEIDCNDAGVPFVEAHTDFDLESLGDLAPSTDISVLLPVIAETDNDISSLPVFAVQVTYFKCGGISIGARLEHHTFDGSSASHILKSWAEINRGLDISIKPFLDRALALCPRDPPRPKFGHPEYSPNQVSDRKSEDLKVTILRLTNDQLDKLKAAVADQSNRHRYSTFDVLAGHIWKCVCKARGRVGFEKETRLMIPMDARFNRWQPKLPLGFFGNAVFYAAPVARAGELVTKPLGFAAAKINEAFVRMDNEYLRSVIDYLALLPDLSDAKIGPRLFDSPNFQITSWVNAWLYDVDFGWGAPIYYGPGSITNKYEKAYIFPSDRNRNGLSVAITFRPQLMDMFVKQFYAFETNSVPSKL